jgi:hypothetical protein
VKWVEIISLRCSSNVDTRFVDELLREVSESDSPTNAPHLVEIRIYHHSVVETDFSIHIYWQSAPGTQDKSPLGLRLSSALRNLGLLNHSVWAETTALEFPPGNGHASSRNIVASVVSKAGRKYCDGRRRG